jgi:ectoine hydroxylase-related dioxygenase (phytanoyl-CoA dioxygenase family)
MKEIKMTDTNDAVVDNTSEAVLDFSLARAAWANEQFQPENDFELRVEQIKMRGFTVFENSYSEEELSSIREKMDAIYKTQVEEVGGDEQLLYDIGDGGIARQLLAYDEYFLKMATNKNVLTMVQKFLGDYFVLYQQNANFHQPNRAHTTTPWHRDLTFWHYTSSRPLAMTALHIIDDYTEESGGLFVLEGTQKHEKFPSDDYVEDNKRYFTPKAGTIIVFDSMMWHSPAMNRSENVKRSLAHFYTMHLIRQEISLPKLLDGKWSDDEFLRRFLGYDVMQQSSPKEWRLEKYKNKRKSLTVY